MVETAMVVAARASVEVAMAVLSMAMVETAMVAEAAKVVIKMVIGGGEGSSQLPHPYTPSPKSSSMLSTALRIRNGRGGLLL